MRFRITRDIFCKITENVREKCFIENELIEVEMHWFLIKCFVIILFKISLVNNFIQPIGNDVLVETRMITNLKIDYR